MRSWDREQVGEVLDRVGVDAWGVAANVPPLPLAPSLPTAIALLKRFEAVELCGVEHGPHETYYAGYLRLNAALDTAAATLVEGLRAAGVAAEYVPPTVPEELYDTITDWGDAGVFAHKTAATRAGLGWIGKTALFVSPEFGSRVRLATVFTDLGLPAGEPVRESGCGECRACVDACPAGCGRDVLWRPGMARELLFDAGACGRHMARISDLESQICGICIAACPFSLRH